MSANFLNKQPHRNHFKPKATKKRKAMKISTSAQDRAFMNKSPAVFTKKKVNYKSQIFKNKKTNQLKVKKVVKKKRKKKN